MLIAQPQNLEVVIKHKRKDGNLFTEKNIKAIKVSFLK